MKRSEYQVDDDIKDFIGKFEWKLAKNKNVSYWYTYINRKRVYMHRLIFGLFGGHSIDHKDRNGLNNKLDNLRLCDQHQNSANIIRRKKNKFGYRGIVKTPFNKYATSINYKNKTYRKCGFDTAEEAAMAYDKMAIKFHGEFAVLNFPNEWEPETPASGDERGINTNNQFNCSSSLPLLGHS